MGRLGPRTRYPDIFLDRLRFISRVRDLEEAGELPTRRLRDIRQAFETLTDEEVHRVATGEMGPEEVRELLDPLFTEAGFFGGDDDPGARIRSAASRKRSLMKAAESNRRAPPQSLGIADGAEKWRGEASGRRDASMLSAALEVGELLARLDAQAKTPGSDKSRSETWLRVPINENVVLSVRNLDERHAGPAEQLVSWLKRLLVAGRRKRD